MDKNYIYTYSYCSALYKMSQYENIACKDAIEKAITDNFNGTTLKEDAAKSVIAQFGYDRVNYVLANSVQRKKYDGRFSQENKDWSKKIYIPIDKVSDIDRRLEFAVDSHPAVLDSFINQARREYQSLNLYEPEHCNDPTKIDFKGKVMVLDPTNLRVEYKNPREQLILCEGGFGCSPTARGRKVYGRYLSDGLCCQYERTDFIGELKSDLLPDWAKIKLNEMGVNPEENMKGMGVNPEGNMKGMDMQ